MIPQTGQHSFPLILVPLVVLFIGLRLRSLSRGRRLRVELLWILPTVLLLLSVAVVALAQPAGLDWLWLGLAFAVGAALGWYRGRMIAITVDPGTHVLTSKASPAALIFIVALFAARYLLRWWVAAHAASWHVKVLVITDALLVFGLGLLSVQRLEMWLRGTRLVAEARAAKGASA